jgi:UDP-3-O-acyl-N-acetylglucosamine deacetylase
MLWRSSIRFIAILFAVTAIFGMVGVTYAEDSPLSDGSTPQFCQRVDNLSSRLLEKTSEYYKSVSPVKFDHDEQLAKRRAAFDKKLAGLRNKAEEDRKAHV